MGFVEIIVYKLRDVVYEYNRGEIIMSIFQYKKRVSSNHVSERDRCNEPGLSLTRSPFCVLEPGK